MTHHFARFALAGLLGFATLPMITMSAPTHHQSQASEIRYIVNNIPVTSYDIARRAAFMKLQGKRGNLSQLAHEEMIRQAVVMSEVQRVGVRISDQQVEVAFQNFAKGNKLSSKQLSTILNQAGVTPAHFKDFVRAQMAFGQAAQLRQRRANSGVNNNAKRDAVRAMLQSNDKPTATEYLLQEVIFVVPAKERSKNLSKRKREAEAMRNRYSGCASGKTLAKGLVDVVVRDMGRFIAQELPQAWAADVKKLSEGKATPVKTTARGAEFVGVCRTRTVSDDRVAELTFQEQELTSQGDKTANEDYVAELRSKARIIKR